MEMSKDIKLKYKNLFYAFLLKNNAAYKFLTALKNSTRNEFVSHTNNNLLYFLLDSDDDEYDFILNAFLWKDAKDGIEWNILNNKWRHILDHARIMPITVENLR